MDLETIGARCGPDPIITSHVCSSSLKLAWFLRHFDVHWPYLKTTLDIESYLDLSRQDT